VVHTRRDAADGFLHTAVAHGSTDELVAVLVPQLRDWARRRDRVYVNLAPERGAAVRAALGADADELCWSDTFDWAPHPVRRLRALQELVEVERAAGAGELRFVGECAFPAGPPELVAEWERFDVLLNDALADAPMTMVCTYDRGAVPDVAARALRTHPMIGLDPPLPNEDVVGADEALWAARPLAPLPASAVRVGERVTPARARALVRAQLGRSAGAPPPWAEQAVCDLAVVVTELVTNAWQAGSGSVGVWCWQEGEEMGVQVDDTGPGLRDPFAGYRRPSPAVPGGRGLWISRQLADLVEIAPNGRGTSVRARIFGGAAHQRTATASTPPTHASPTTNHAT